MPSSPMRNRLGLGLALLALVFAGCVRPRPAPAPQGNPAVGPVPTLAPRPTVTPLAPTPTAAPIVELPAADAFLAREAAASRFSGAVLVARQGRILLKKGYGLADRELGLANTPQTRFHIASLTKQFTAMAILQLQERGKLKVTDRISSHLAGCPPAWRDITIEHLLTHTSGLVDYFELQGQGAPPEQPVSPGEIVGLFRNRPLLFAPGSRHSYSNSGYVILGQIIEQASGESYASWIERNILAPLGMASTTYRPSCLPGSCAVGYETAWVRAPNADLSIGYAAGGLCSTVEDLYLWDQALYTTRLCSQASLDSMFASRVKVAENVWCGYGWFIRNISGRRRLAHSGLLYGYSGIIARFPAERATIILLSNLENAPVTEYADVLAREVFK